MIRVMLWGGGATILIFCRNYWIGGLCEDPDLIHMPPVLPVVIQSLPHHAHDF